MSMFVATGEVREVVCACGQLVKQTQGWLTGTTGTPFWSTARHDAPCGLPCFGAAVNGRAYSAGEFHHPEGRCPRCAPDATNPDALPGLHRGGRRRLCPSRPPRATTLPNPTRGSPYERHDRS